MGRRGTRIDRLGAAPRLKFLRAVHRRHQRLADRLNGNSAGTRKRRTAYPVDSAVYSIL
jgi:hypothetical protein